MKINEIEIVLSSHNSDKIIDFILNYNFQDNYEELYLNFLLNFDYTKRNSLLASYVIDIAYYKKIKDRKLIELFKSLLCVKLNYLVKLSILDYFVFLNIKLNKSEIIQIQKTNKYSYRTLKLQFFLISIYYNFDIVQNVQNVLILLKKRNCSHIELIRILNILNIDKVQKNVKLILKEEKLLKILKDELIFYNDKYASINERFDEFMLIYKT
jgi:hypothetical protein